MRIAITFELSNEKTFPFYLAYTKHHILKKRATNKTDITVLTKIYSKSFVERTMYRLNLIK